MPSLVLPRDTVLIEIDVTGTASLALEPHAWCLLAATEDVLLTIDPRNPGWPYVLTFGTAEEVLAFRAFFAGDEQC